MRMRRCALPLAIAASAGLAWPEAGQCAAPQAGLQELIDQAARAHLTRVTVEPHPDGKEWVVTAPLHVPPGLTLVAGKAETVLAAADDPGKPYRSQPVFLLSGTGGQILSDVTVSGFRLRGRFAAAPIALRNVRDVRLTGIEIEGSRGKAISVENGRDVVIARLTARFERAPAATGGAPPAEGGAGVWCFGCTHTTVQDSVLEAPPFWQPGPAWDSGNAAVCAPGLVHPGCYLSREGNGLARALDLVAFYGGAGNAILRNRLSASNAAAIYVNLCRSPGPSVPARSTDLRVEGNVIADMREHGIDIVSADRPVIARNDIRRVGGAAVAVADTARAEIAENAMTDVSLAWRRASAATPPSAIRVLRGSRGARIGHNTGIGGAADVYVSPDSDAGARADSR